jgi:hypothetical protein
MRKEKERKRIERLRGGEQDNQLMGLRGMLLKKDSGFRIRRKGLV